MTDPASSLEEATPLPPAKVEQPALPSDNAHHESLALALRHEQFYRFLKGGDGLNPMVDACSGVLAALMRLHTLTEADQDAIESLYHHVNEELFTLDTTLRKIDLYDEIMILSCRYSLCIMLDEAALKKPWMQQSTWAEQPLTGLHYHKKPTDDKLDDILARLLMNPTKYKAVLELIYNGLLLGYEGIHSYGLDASGKTKRKAAKKELQHFLSTYWSKPKQQLTDPYQYSIKKVYKIAKVYSPWIIYTVTLAVLCIIYWFFDYLIDADTQEILRQLRQLSVEKE